MTPVLAIVGYSNSGKTILMEKLIAAISAKGFDVCSIKHSHHPTSMDIPGKDSWRHKQAGAKASLLVGSEQICMVADVQDEQTPQSLADLYFAHADVVLVEGYASMPCAKIEVVRKARSTALRCSGSDLLAVVTDVDDLDVDVPKLDLHDDAAIVDFVLDFIASGGVHHG